MTTERKMSDCDAMIETAQPDLEALALDAAREVAGVDSVEEIEVTTGVDWTDQPVYYFAFLIDQGRALLPAGLLQIRLGQKIRDKLISLKDDHYPMIQMLARADWEKRKIARS